ncbi:uncharacterized protein LOC126184031 [Schistocerca cancellata]|uniref:uncharacterized protein LOC126184031 n=1 Tax=Schistocerca cancellata TaxID=274614 RepID=UPI002118BB3E|nr:uncharacterized protein LOC126184031 [Schistocerca cancellata]
MKGVLGILLLLLMLTARSTPSDDPHRKTTGTSFKATLSITLEKTDASICSTATTTKSADLSSAYLATADASAAAAGEHSFRLPDTRHEESPDYYDDENNEDGTAPAPEGATDYEPPDYYDDDETYEAASADRKHPSSGTAPVLEGATDYEPPDYYDDDETYEAASADRTHPSSGTAPVLEGATDYEPPDYYDDDETYEAASADRMHPSSSTAPVLEGATDYEPPDYYDDDETYEAASADRTHPSSGTAPVLEGATDYEPRGYYDDETPESASEDRLLPESDNASVAEGACSAERQGRGYNASRGKAMTSSTGELDIDDAVAAAEISRPINWISWLPSWCRNWPLYGPLGVPRDVQLQAYSQALEEHNIGIGNYWTQSSEPADDDEQSRAGNPQTHYISLAVRQSQMLQEFYQWIFQQLSSPEASGDCTPESLHRFLDALEYQAHLVESICNRSPTMRLTCNASNSSIFGNFFWVMDTHSIWMQVFNNWAIRQFDIGAVSHGRQRRLPTDGIPSFNMSNFSIRSQTAGDSTLGLEAVSADVCGVEEVRRVREPELIHNEDLNAMSEATAEHNSYPIQRQLESRNQERKFPTCLLQSLSVTSQEIQWPGLERFRDQEAGVPSEDVRDEFEAAFAPLQNRVHPNLADGQDVNPDEGFNDDHSQLAVQSKERMTESVSLDEEEHLDMDSDPRNLRGCSEIPVLQVLGSDFDPYFMLYVKCNERDETCEPPEKCLPMNTVVSVTMPRWATLPEFPHSVVDTRQLPSGRISTRLLVPTSCVCREPSA